MLSSLFVWENFAITSTVRRITSTIRPSSVRMNVSSARVSNRVIRYGIESMTTNFAISALFALYHNF